jgi:hypothetical protein
MVDIGYRIRECENGRLVEEPTVATSMKAVAAVRSCRQLGGLFRPPFFVSSRCHHVIDYVAWVDFDVRRAVAPTPRSASNPMSGSMSISDGFSRATATGGLVLDNVGRPNVLSNFHVLASRGYARAGLPIINRGAATVARKLSRASRWIRV